MSAPLPEPQTLAQVPFKILEEILRQLRSTRWGAALSKGRLPDLKNPEMNPTSVLRSVMVWVSLAGLTFVVLLVGYGLGIWKFV